MPLLHNGKHVSIDCSINIAFDTESLQNELLTKVLKVWPIKVFKLRTSILKILKTEYDIHIWNANKPVDDGSMSATTPDLLHLIQRNPVEKNNDIVDRAIWKILQRKTQT